MGTVCDKAEAFLSANALQEAALGDEAYGYDMSYARHSEIRRQLELWKIPLVLQSTVGETIGTLYRLPEGEQLWIYRNARTGVLRVIIGKQALYTDDVIGEKCFDDTVLYQAGNAIKGNSMTYVLRLCDGSFVLIDGGIETEEAGIRTMMKQLSGSEKPPRIRAWILTHPHFDHVTLFIHAAESLKPEAVYVNFPDFAENEKRDADATRQNRLVHQTMQKLQANGCLISKPYTGQRFKVGNLQFETLYSQEAWTFSENMTTVNDASMVLKMTTESGTTVLFLADVMEKAGAILLAQYSPAVLKSDYVQVAHHSMYGPDYSLYEAIVPEACLWPVSASEYARYGEDIPRNIRLRALPIPHYISYQGDKMISLR